MGIIKLLSPREIISFSILSAATRKQPSKDNKSSCKIDHKTRIKAELIDIRVKARALHNFRSLAGNRQIKTNNLIINVSINRSIRGRTR